MTTFDATVLDDDRPARPDEGEHLGAGPLVSKAKALFLLAAALSFLISVFLWFLVDREQGLFVGLWVPSILSLGSLLLAGKGPSS